MVNIDATVLCEVDTYRRRVSMQKDEQSVNGYLDYITSFFFSFVNFNFPKHASVRRGDPKIIHSHHHTKKSPPKRHTDKIQKQVGTTNF